MSNMASKLNEDQVSRLSLDASGQEDAIRRVASEYLQTPYELFKQSYRIDRQLWADGVVTLSYLQQKLLSSQYFRFFGKESLERAIANCDALIELSFNERLKYNLRSRVFLVMLGVQRPTVTYKLTIDDYQAWVSALSSQVSYAESD